MSEEIRKFLMGEAPLEGVWFGDEHPTRRGKFWWRELLRNEPNQDELLSKTKTWPNGNISAWHENARLGWVEQKTTGPNNMIIGPVHDSVCISTGPNQSVDIQSQDELWVELIAYSTWRMKQPRKWHNWTSTEAKPWTEEDYLQSYLKQKNATG